MASTKVADRQLLTPPGGSGSATEYELDFDSLPVSSKSFIITDALVSTGSKIFISLSGNSATGRIGNDYSWDSITYSVIPGTGSFTVDAIVTNGSVVDKRKIYYTIL